jgi:hypothetical protein
MSPRFVVGYGWAAESREPTEAAPRSSSPVPQKRDGVQAHEGAMPRMRRAHTWASAERGPGAWAVSRVRRLHTSGESGASGSTGASGARAARGKGSAPVSAERHRRAATRSGRTAVGVLGNILAVSSCPWCTHHSLSSPCPPFLALPSFPVLPLASLMRAVPGRNVPTRGRRSL